MKKSVQSVIPERVNVQPFFASSLARHIFALILTCGRKNYSSISRELQQQYGFMCGKVRKQSTIEHAKNILHRYIAQRSQKHPGTLIVDFTMQRKPYAQKTARVTYDYDGSGKNVQKGISLCVASWTDGIVTIPFMYTNWLRRADAGDHYQKKTDITLTVIMDAVQNNIPFTRILLDGAFATKKIIHTLTQLNLEFIIRMPKNRVITTTDGVLAQIKKHPMLKLHGNTRYRVIKAVCQDMQCFIIAYKRKGRNGTIETVFLISNVALDPKKYVEQYAIRWNTEKFFRTSKQSLGMLDCQSTSKQKQDEHLHHVMVAYAALEHEKICRRKKSPEDILRCLRFRNSLSTFHRLAFSINEFIA